MVSWPRIQNAPNGGPVTHTVWRIYRTTEEAYHAPLMVTQVSKFKSWDEHSERWKRDQAKAGLSKQRWNSFLKLSDKSQRSADIRQYAKGFSVGEQRKEKARSIAAEKITSSRFGNDYVSRKGVDSMTAAQLRWTANATPDQIRARARNSKYIVNNRNPWWYKS